ncbi:MAG: ATP-binding cassette domain-containing protein [Erysipelotrichaceae bacterium]|nr:ATP-binding cassette domain-containing protein [Erysipelotrichaceae bacterium]MDY5251218.1 ATP-binding cassette domain-containing protein [Erysipelotrichaceae bacterium]
MRIEITNLSKSFGKHVIFDDFNLNIEAGKITCLYGASGCGKTTILNILGLVEPYDSGEITYDGKVIRNRKNRINFLRNDVGFIFQDFGLLENETVWENMQIVYKIKSMKDAKMRIEQVLNDLNLQDMLHRKVYELSGGEQQRVAIAKMILKDPDLILADEPTASLDDDNKQIVLSMLRMLQQKGKTIIIVSHDEQVRYFADIAINLTGGIINE